MKCTFYVEKKGEESSGLGLWCLTPLSTIFQLYRGGQFYCLTKRSPLKKPLGIRLGIYVGNGKFISIRVR